MIHPQYIDISGWQQPDSIDWQKYKAWSASVDGISRVAIKINEGTAGIDAACHRHWNNALAAGIDQIILYHYARPDLNPGWQGARDECAAFRHQLGTGLRPNDLVMLDYEQAPELADWCYDWLHDCAVSTPAERIAVYANLNTVETKLAQYPALAAFPLILADWTYNPDAIPPPPAPWKSLMALQWTNKDMDVPGVPERVDCNVFLHGPAIVPPPTPPDPTIQRVIADLQNIEKDGLLHIQQAVSDALAALSVS